MTAIVYVSNTGSAKTYAEMLGEKTGFDVYSLADSGSGLWQVPCRVSKRQESASAASGQLSPLA